MATGRMAFFSNALCRTVSFHVVLPNDLPEPMRQGNPCYDRAMKTLYLLHGYSGSEIDWPWDFPLRELAGKYNLAFICPNGENSFYLDSDATGCKYGAYVGEELVTYTRKLFGLSERREDTFVGGFSMGGFGAVRTALAYPRTFWKAAAFSPAMIVYDVAHMKPGEHNQVANYAYYRRVFGDLEQVTESRNNPEVLVRELKEKKERVPGIYQVVGTEDFLYEPNQIFRRFMEKQHTQYRYEESSGGHDLAFWNRYLEPAVRWLTEEE